MSEIIFFFLLICRGMTRWGEYVDLHQIDEATETPQDTEITEPLPGWFLNSHLVTIEFFVVIFTRNVKTPTMFVFLAYAKYKKTIIYLCGCVVHLLKVVASATSKGPPFYETTTLRPMRRKSTELETESNLFRCMSDASLVKRRRGRGKSAAQREKEKQHRFSINGHFYNYKVSFPS